MKKFGVNLPEELIDGWNLFCQQRGLASYRALMASMRVFMAMNPDLREAALSGNDTAIQKAVGGLAVATSEELAAEIVKRVDQVDQLSRNLRREAVTQRYYEIEDGKYVIERNPQFAAATFKLDREARFWGSIADEIQRGMPQRSAEEQELSADILNEMNLTIDDHVRGTIPAPQPRKPTPDRSQSGAASTSEAVAKVEADHAAATKASENRGPRKAAGPKRRPA